MPATTPVISPTTCTSGGTRTPVSSVRSPTASWPTTPGTPRSTPRWGCSCATGTRRSSPPPSARPTRRPGDRRRPGPAAPPGAGRDGPHGRARGPPEGPAPRPRLGARAPARLPVAARGRRLRVRLHRLEHPGVVHELARADPALRLRRAAQLPGPVARRAVEYRRPQHPHLHRRVRRRLAGARLHDGLPHRAGRTRRGLPARRLPLPDGAVLHRDRHRLALAAGQRPRPGDHRPQPPADRPRARLPAFRLAPVGVRLGGRRGGAPGRVGAVRVRDGAVPGRPAGGARRHPGRGPRRRGQRGAGVLARHPAASASGTAQRGRHPRAHLVEDVRPAVRARPTEPEDRDAVALYVVHHVRRRLLQPGRHHRDHPAARRRAADGSVHLVLGTEGAGMTTAGAPPRAPRVERRWPTVLRYVVLYGLAVLFLMPVYVLVVTALKNPADVS